MGIKLNKTILGGVMAVSLLFGSVLSVAVATTVPAYAVTPLESACQGAGGTFNPSTGECASGGQSLQQFITNIINILLFIVGVAAVIVIIIGGLRYILSSGDQASITSAKNTILYAVIGLIVALLAYAIVNFVLSSL